ncbi:uncharacterized protein LOC106776001 isoform X4 [Vigna radiata var. radiata]|uniref:Uncharacterized protein LOC106776001 isoform X4 n=1 Tax=Vigna radiata var. radiata TaxID=3916 RepID=A0A3Q0FID9_VIGRR|nr:uncharacterized protein LOC106776001 isoform X4 [Vigna radiata var. radiata]
MTLFSMSLLVYLGVLVLFIMCLQVLINSLQKLLSVSFWDILAFRKGINVIVPQPRGIICLLMSHSLNVRLFSCPSWRIVHLFNKCFLYHHVIPWLLLLPYLKPQMQMTLFLHLFSHISVRHNLKLQTLKILKTQILLHQFPNPWILHPLHPLLTQIIIGLLPFGKVPNNVHETLGHPGWRQAMIDEMQALEHNGTWDLVPLPLGNDITEIAQLKNHLFNHFQTKDLGRLKSGTIKGRCYHFTKKICS